MYTTVHSQIQNELYDIDFEWVVQYRLPHFFREHTLHQTRALGQGSSQHRSLDEGSSPRPEHKHRTKNMHAAWILERVASELATVKIPGSGNITGNIFEKLDQTTTLIQSDFHGWTSSFVSKTLDVTEWND